MRHSTVASISGLLGLALALTAGEAGAGFRNPLQRFVAGPAAAIAAIGPERVAATAGGRLELLDLTAPDSPALLGALEIDGAITAVDVAGNALWATTDTPRLAAIDIADPAHPRLLATRRLPSYPYHVAADGDRVAVSADRYVLMFGLPPAGGISLDGIVGDPSAGYPGGIDLVGDLLYLGAYDARQLEIWDVSADPHPTRLGAVAVSQPSGPVEVAGTVAAVHGYGIDLVDVSDPTAPLAVATTGDAIEDTAGPFDLDGTRLIFTTWRTCQLWDVDVSDPAAPHVVSRSGEFCDSRGIAALDGGFALAASAAGVRIRRNGVSSLWSDFGQAESVAFAGDLVVFGDDGGSVGVLEVGPDGPELRGAVDLLPGDPADFARVLVAAADDRAVAIHAGAVSVLDLTDPATPVEAARLAAAGSPIGAVLDGGLAYLAVGTELLVADVAVPSDAAILGRVDHGLIALGLAVGDGWAAVTGVYSGAIGHLTLIDLTVPADPQVLATLGFEHQCHGVAVAGDLVVIAAEDAGLILVDASQPGSPEVLGTVPVADAQPTGGVWLDGGIAWVSGGSDAACPLRRIDLRDPTVPRDLGCVADLHVADIDFAAGRLAIARGAAGIAVGSAGFNTRPVPAGADVRFEQ